MTHIWPIFNIIFAMFVLGAIAWYLGRLQTEARWAKRRTPELSRGVRLQLERKLAEARERAAEETARRKTMDEFLSQLHAEERAFSRRQAFGSAQRRSVVLEERLCLGRLPISNWSRQELTFYTASGQAGSAKMLPRPAA
ncbi:MAG: hypothetical protein HY822_14065 [Acidobacteria bacterium]|nr:hypothetical protein [Acidobacteriota bacterium]